MSRALKGRMPRTLPDHRSTLAKQLRGVYDDIGGRFSLTDGVSRRVALLAARAWLDYERLSRESEQLASHRPREKDARQRVAFQLTRLRRRQSSFAGQFLGGLRTLEGLANGHAPRSFDPLADLMQAGAGREERMAEDR